MGIVEQEWKSPRLTRWFLGLYLGWILLGSVLSWFRHSDVDGSLAARVVFVHTKTERVAASGHVTIHEYASEPSKCRFVGDSRLQVYAKKSNVLKLSLTFHNVRREERMTIRSRSGSVDHVVNRLFSHKVRVSIPLTAGENDIELSFGQQDVQYVMVAVELIENEPAQDKVVTRRDWIPFLKRGGVQFSVGAGWFLPLPDLTGERPFTHTGQHAYLLLTTEEPGDYEILLGWLRDNVDYGPPSLLLDGEELSPLEVIPGPPESRTRVQLRLEGEHVLLMKLNDRIVSPLSRWESLDQRFLGYQVSWNLLKIHRLE